MIIFIILLLFMLVFALLGWFNESRYKKRLLLYIREQVQKEIGWIRLHGEQQVRRDEIKAYKKVLEILEQWL